VACAHPNNARLSRASASFALGRSGLYRVRSSPTSPVRVLGRAASPRTPSVRNASAGLLARTSTPSQRVSTRRRASRDTCAIRKRDPIRAQGHGGSPPTHHPDLKPLQYGKLIVRSAHEHPPSEQATLITTGSQSQCPARGEAQRPTPGSAVLRPSRRAAALFFNGPGQPALRSGDLLCARKAGRWRSYCPRKEEPQLAADLVPAMDESQQ
jgi:hypothetical protein